MTASITGTSGPIVTTGGLPLIVTSFTPTPNGFVATFNKPLDSTQLKLDEVKREILFRHGSPLTDQLTLLCHQWGQLTPTLFDPMAVAYAIDPKLCPVTPLRIRVDEKGYTKPERGTPNVSACLESNSGRFFDFLMPRLMQRTR